MTSCFVVMGFNTKKIPNTNIEVDLNQVYNNLIKPTILEKELVSVHGKNHFRADEVFSTQSITKTFIEGILKADIVIADITTLNPNQPLYCVIITQLRLAFLILHTYLKSDMILIS